MAHLSYHDVIMFGGMLLQQVTPQVANPPILALHLMIMEPITTEEQPAP